MWNRPLRSSAAKNLASLPWITAPGITVVTEAELLPWLRSTGEVAETVAVLVCEPAVGTTVSVKVALAPEARLATVQVTVPELLAHPVEADENVSPAGSTSVTLTPVAVLGPAFETVIV